MIVNIDSRISHTTSKSPAPKTMRDVLTLFRSYDNETGLEGLLAGIDLADIVPRQIYYAVHGRPPESIDTALAERDHAIGNIFAAALRSGEFRKKIIRSVLTAFPEKRRLLFVDIPRCGASDLSRLLAGRVASLNSNVINPDLVNDNELFLALRRLMIELPESEAILIYGHVDLYTYEAWDALRHDDSIFTVLADPVDLVLSQVNYVLSRIAASHAPPAADTLGWRKEFAVDGDDIVPGTLRTEELGRLILRHRGVVQANRMSAYLGSGHAVRAVENIVTRHVEVTDITNYPAWCRERWQIDGVIADAGPEIYFPREALTAADTAVIEEITNEDCLLYSLVTDRLVESGRHAVVGRGLVLPPPPSSGSLPRVVRKPARAVPRAEETIARGDLMLSFESLGENCEFGLVQRRCGAEPLGLLRFSSSPLPKLMKALEWQFEGMGMAENIEIRTSPNGQEYMVFDRKFGFLYHAWVNAKDQTPEQVHKREVSRVPFLVRKLIEDLTSAEKIFVFHGMQPLTDQEAWDLRQALRQYGPNTLLWVECATDDRPAGAVDSLDDGFYKGYIDRFAPTENAHDFSLDCWIELCRNVHGHRYAT